MESYHPIGNIFGMRFVILWLLRLTKARNVTADPKRAINGKETPLDYAWGQTYPILDIKSEAMACGREAFKSARTTETANIKAGQVVGFQVSTEFDGTSVRISIVFLSGGLC